MEGQLLTFNQKLTQLLANKPVILQMLRFAAIGALNTALDFIILNYVTKAFGVESGLNLGLLNVISFSAAMIQSYLWNRAWTFASSNASPLSNLFRLIIVGGLGFVSFFLVVVGGIYSVVDTYYLFILIVFLIAEILIWYGFGLNLAGDSSVGVGHQFGVFLIVSLIGLLINSGIVVVASLALAPTLSNLINVDSVKNVAKILATMVSLIWNFVGYKLFVFKK
mgnify:CR=1 FL=1